jgi:aryl-alcohol dehydrogenase-like predicted oxidoreductase
MGDQNDTARRRIGSSELEAGPIGFGAMGMSFAYDHVTSEDDPVKVIQRAIDLGSTMIDTADVYGPHTNEELVGRAIAGRREQVVVATKVGLSCPDNDRDEFERGRDLERDGSPANIKQGCDESLRRLGIDVIDLFYLHRPDDRIPIEESIGAFAELQDAGKIRAIGVSEVDVETLERAQSVRPLAAVQSEFSLWTRAPIETGVMAWCEENDVAMIPYSPLGRGFLTGRYEKASDFPEGDVRSRHPRFQPAAIEANLAIVARVRDVAARLEVAPGQVALAWLLTVGSQVIPIPGTKRFSYLEENIAAADVTLDAEALQALDELPDATGVWTPGTVTGRTGGPSAVPSS